MSSLAQVGCSEAEKGLNTRLMVARSSLLCAALASLAGSATGFFGAPAASVASRSAVSMKVSQNHIHARRFGLTN